VRCGGQEIAHCTTDLEGVYQLLGLPETVLQVLVRGGANEPYLLSGEVRIEAHRENVLDLDRHEFRLAGRVIDAVSGKPLPHAKVRYSFDAEERKPSRRSVLLDADGSFLLPPLPVHHLLFDVECRGYFQRERVPFRALDRSSRQAALALEPAGQIRLRLTSADGIHASGPVRVLFRPEKGNRKELSGTKNGRYEEGKPWILEPLRKATYEVFVKHLGSGRKASGTCKVEPGETVRLQLEL
jgi:hypothetical protein